MNNDRGVGGERRKLQSVTIQRCSHDQSPTTTLIKGPFTQSISISGNNNAQMGVVPIHFAAVQYSLDNLTLTNSHAPLNSHVCSGHNSLSLIKM